MEKPGLDATLRKNVLENLIYKKLKNHFPETFSSDGTSKLYQLAQKFEEKVYCLSKDKEDYRARILNRLSPQAWRKFVDAMGVNRKQADVSLPTMQQRSMSIRPSSNQLMQGHQIGHQSVVSPVQQHWPPMREQRSMLVNQSCQQQPLQLLSPSVISQEQKDRIQNCQAVVDGETYSLWSSTMQPRSISIQRSSNQLMQDQTVSSSLQQHWPMKEQQHSMCQQPSRLLSPSVISQGQRDWIQDVRLQGTHMPSNPLHCRNIVGDDRHSLQSPPMQPGSISIQPYSNQLMQDHQTGHKSVISPVQQYWPMTGQSSMPISRDCQQPSQFLSPSVISKEPRDQIQDGGIQGAHMASTSLQPRSLVGEDKHSPQSTMKQQLRSIQTYSNQLMQDHQTGHQTVVSFEQQHRPMKIQRTMPITESCQQPSPLPSPSVISQEQRDWVQDARLQWTQMRSTSLQGQTVVGEDKRSPQSPMISQRDQIQDARSQGTDQIQDARSQGTHMPSTPSAAFGSSLPDADWKLLMLKFQDARSRYLPRLMELRELTKESGRKGKNQESLKAAKHFGIQIKFFTKPETEVMTKFSKESFSELLINNIKACERTFQSYQQCRAARNRKPQSSGGQTCLNNEPSTLTDNTTQVVDKESLPHHSPEGTTADQDTHVNVVKDPSLSQSSIEKQPQKTLQSRNPRLSQSSSEKQPRKSRQSRKWQQVPADPMNSLFPSMAKLPKRFSTNIVQKKNTARALKSSAISEPKETGSDHLPSTAMTLSSAPKGTVSDHLPSTPMTPSSAPKGTVSDHLPSTPMTPSSAPKEPVSDHLPSTPMIPSSTPKRTISDHLPSTSMKLSSAPKETVSDHLPSTPMAPSSAPKETVSDHLPLTLITPSSAPEGIGNPSQQPLERLTQVIQSMSKEALRSSIDSIASAMEAVDKLPNYAKYSTKSSHRNIKRNIDSVGCYASTLDNSASGAKRSRNEIDHSLMDEIRETNQRLVETTIEVDCHSHSGSRNGTIIKCTYKPVSLSENLKRHFAPMTSLTTLSIKLLVPSNYPYFPPKILDQVPVEYCTEIKDLMEKVKSRFDRRARSLLSLGELAQAWDESARSVVFEAAVCLGGNTFTSKYGTWECVPAA